MGYYIRYDMHVTLKSGTEEAALAAINALHTPDNLRTNANGGSFSGGEMKERWYSWVNNPPEGGFKTLEEAFAAWRFNYPDFYFTGEKLGDEELLFQALTPYLEGDIYARGEDDELWGYRFVDGEMIELAGELTWTEV